MTLMRTLAVLGLMAVVAGCGGKVASTSTSKSTSTQNAAASLPWPYTTPEVDFGFIRSFTPLGRGYKLRLDLHLLFSADDTGIAACIDNHDCHKGTTGFPDDTYDRDLHYVVTYYVPATASVELVGYSGTVTARYLYGLTQGHNPRHVQVMARGHDALIEFAFYVELASPSGKRPSNGYDSVARLYQQFHP